MTEQSETRTQARAQMDEEIRQAVIAWLTDLFANKKYRMADHNGGSISRDHFLEITNETNVDLRELRMQLELLSERMVVDKVTAKTGVSGIRAGESGRLGFFTKEQYFDGFRLVPETVEYKADRVPDKVIEARPKKKRLFGRKKKTVSEAFRAGTGEQLQTKRNEYVQKLEDLRNQTADEEIRQGLDQLIPIIGNIFRRAAEVTGAEMEIKRLTDRYLPMIINSTESYLSYAKRDITGEDMDELKQEVISGIRLVTEACGNLLNRLYEDGIVDASTDISVLKMMLKQDGLLDSEFEK